MIRSPNFPPRAAHALARFGFGSGPGDLARVSSDPRGWTEAQLVGPLMPQALVAHEGSAPRVVDLMAARRANAEDQAWKDKSRDRYRSDVALRTRIAATSDAPLIERIVQFWSNHFSVSAQRPVIAPLGLPFETEAIRPHVLGRFRDMAQAAILHPAMLIYLDNIQSIGPDSRAGQRRDRGLNENLGREALELHLLGVDGGYGQDDVRAMAMILTGWSLDRENGNGTSLFRPNLHQPGTKILLGQKIPESGAGEVVTAIDMLCAHPSTARHLATKLARHFIADDPPTAAIEQLATVFQDSDGDLALVTRALLAMDAAWDQPLAKMRTPNDFVTATLRATGLPISDQPLVNALSLLGQMPFAAPSPAGWPDQAADWTGPDAIIRRIDWSLAFAHRIGGQADAAGLIDVALGDLADMELRRVVAQAPSPAEAFALVLCSPPFQRR